MWMTFEKWHLRSSSGLNKHTQKYIHVSTDTCSYTCICAHTNMHVSTCKHICTHMHTHAYKHEHAHMHAKAHTHKCTCTHTISHSSVCYSPNMWQLSFQSHILQNQSWLLLLTKSAIAFFFFTCPTSPSSSSLGNFHMLKPKKVRIDWFEDRSSTRYSETL